jgi:amidohydrolase
MTAEQQATARSTLEAAYPALVELSHRIHANPELEFEEFEASRALEDALEGAGFRVQRGYGEMPTAFVASTGPGPLHVVICAEYDALPEVGHACGHNIIGTAALGAGMALQPLVDALGLKVTVLGTPAEEGGGGKIGFVESGFFRDVHAALMVHTWPTDVAEPALIAVQQLRISYHGRAAHASGFPWRGINAADAMVVAQTAIGLLRQQLMPGDRVHGIVTHGGEASNIIPERTSADFMVRADTSERLVELIGLVRRCFEAGALATGAELELELSTSYKDVRHDGELAAIYRRHLESFGRTFEESSMPVSTDMGNVSHEVPAIHPMISIESHGAVNHQKAFAAACATPSADQAIFDGALGMALTIIDMASDPGLRGRLLGGRA